MIESGVGAVEGVVRGASEGALGVVCVLSGGDWAWALVCGEAVTPGLCAAAAR